MNIVNKITKQALTTIIVVTMGLFTVNNVLFLHVHVLPGGEIQIHAHPFKTSAPAETSGTGVPAGDHSHSKAQYTYFGHTQQVIPWIILLILLVMTMMIIRVTFPENHLPAWVCLSFVPTRGPPLFF